MHCFLQSYLRDQKKSSSDYHRTQTHHPQQWNALARDKGELNWTFETNPVISKMLHGDLNNHLQNLFKEACSTESTSIPTYINSTYFREKKTKK
jgi:hypothetical protein